MKAKEKCISKWEKRLQKAKEQQIRWKLPNWEQILIMEEVIKDLKRLK